jgi:hypothetical protein
MMSIEDKSHNMMATPNAPEQEHQELLEHDDEDLQVFHDDNEEEDNSDFDEEPQSQRQAGRRQTAAVTAVLGIVNKEDSRICNHIKQTTPPIFLASHPEWMENVIKATPVFCGLLSLTKTVEILGPKDLETRRSDIILY